MEDIGLGAFSVFFTQSPSFLAHQKAMQDTKGANNAQTLFQVRKIPTANHIRDTLDPVDPKHLFPIYDSVYEALGARGILDTFQGVHNTRLIALDGTWYFSSENIECKNCSHIEHKKGEITNYHSAITPVIIAPGMPYAIPLRPEFIIPQDGHKKQDCEIVAGKRWLEKNGYFYQNGNTTLLGDDIYAHQPFCKNALLYDPRRSPKMTHPCSPEWTHPLARAKSRFGLNSEKMTISKIVVVVLWERWAGCFCPSTVSTTNGL